MLCLLQSQLAVSWQQWRFFSFCGHAVSRWLTLRTWTHSAIFLVSLAEPNSRLTAHLELRNSTANSQLKLSIQPLCKDRRETTVSNNTPIVVGVYTDPLFRNGLLASFFCCLRVCCACYLATAGLTRSLLSNGSIRLNMTTVKCIARCCYLEVQHERFSKCRLRNTDASCVLLPFFFFFLSFPAPELCAHIHNVRIANASLLHTLYGLVW
jgi:hypothetical protein